MDLEKLERVEKEKNKKIGNKGKEGDLLECHHCGYLWIYTGEKVERANCPKCQYKVNIPKAKVDLNEYKKKLTYSELENMDGGTRIIYRPEAKNVKIQKNRVISGFSLKPKYIIWEGVFSNNQIDLSEEELKEWKEEANTRNTPFEDFVLFKVDKKKGIVDKVKDLSSFGTDKSEGVER